MHECVNSIRQTRYILECFVSHVYRKSHRITFNQYEFVNKSELEVTIQWNHLEACSNRESWQNTILLWNFFRPKNRQIGSQYRIITDFKSVADDSGLLQTFNSYLIQFCCICREKNDSKSFVYTMCKCITWKMYN